MKFLKFCPSKIFCLIILTIFFSSLFGFLAGSFFSYHFYKDLREYFLNLALRQYIIERPEKIADESQALPVVSPPLVSQEAMIIEVVKNASPSVVSIIITKDLPILEEYYYNPLEEFEEFFGQPFQFEVPQYRQEGTEKREVGGGTGFIISEDGMILTNRHVVLDQAADYTVLTNDGQKFPAKVLARDPVKDLAVIKVETERKFKPLELGDSDKLQPGQTTIAIGNALGEFRNTVSVGVISGLKRTISASGGGQTELLEDVIQTDSAINQGNSGGPLLNLQGEVIGVNTAMAQLAENIGFAIPINQAKKDIRQVKSLGKIVYPFLGVRYIIINKEVQKENNLSVDYGVWIIKGERPQDVAISLGSAADKAGLKENDIILEFDDKKITSENSLTKIIWEYEPGDRVDLKILRTGQEKIIPVVLGERSE